MASGDFRLLGVRGLVVQVPGVNENTAPGYEVRVLQGTTDAITSPEQRELISNAREYAKSYNQTILSAKGPAENTSEPLPEWLTKMIAGQKNSRYPYEVEESTYDGKRAFLIIHTEIDDVGDEYVLLNENGNELCKFGGVAGHVTSGSCDIDGITVRRIYPYK
jgi:hypothetical protein